MIVRGSIWKYRDQGVDLGTTWKERIYNDNVWSSGRARLGYGGDGEVTTVSYGPSSTSKYITTYFRRWFDVPANLSVNALVFRLQRDDGAVVYLNGTEVFRSNMPNGPIAYNTLSGANIVSETAFFSTNIINPSSILVNGTNICAVEIHQSATNSSDISFELQLVATSPPTVGPQLKLQFVSGNTYNLSWSPAGAATLQSAPTVTGVWTNTGNNANPQQITISPAAPPKFFRLVP